MFTLLVSVKISNDGSASFNPSQKAPILMMQRGTTVE